MSDYRNAAFELRYKPVLFEDIVMPSQHVSQELQAYVDKQTMRPLLLHGPYGTGKSTIAELLPPAILDSYEQRKSGASCFKTKGDGLWLTGDSRRNVGHKLDGIRTFCSLVPLPPYDIKVVVLDEACSLDKDVQTSLKAMLDEYMERVLFIMTANNVESMDGGLKSRSTVLPISKPKIEDWLPKAKSILQQEEVPLPNDQVLCDVMACDDGAPRTIMQNLQTYVLKVRNMQDAA